MDKLSQRDSMRYTVDNRGLQDRSCGNERNDSEVETEWYFLQFFNSNQTQKHKFETLFEYGPGSSVGIATGYGLDGPGIESRCGEIFCTCPDRPWCPSSLLCNGYRVFPGGKGRPGRAADHSPPSSAAVMED